MGLFDFLKKKQRIVYDDGVVIEYETLPPNFRNAAPPDEFGMEQTCGSCKFHGNIRSAYPTCTQYGVQFHGVGCLTKTVCDDFKSIPLMPFGL